MPNQQERTNKSAAVEDEYAGYTVRDRDGSKIGKVDDLFLDENDRPEYVGLKMGFFGTRSTLVPLDACTVDGGRGFVEVNKTKQEVKDAPNFDDGEITPDYKRRVREYYGLGAVSGSQNRGGYGAYYDGEDRDGDETSYHGFTGTEHGGDGTSYHGNDDQDRGGYATSYHGAQNGTSHASRTGHADEERQDGAREAGTDAVRLGPGTYEGDAEGGRFRGRSEDDVEGANQRDGSDLEDEDELRVRRSEEELMVGVREREAGKLNVKKRVRTERERIAVPKKREEVSVERVPVNRGASGSEIGEDEVVVPVVEEEVFVDKRAVVKEELRIKKDVVEEEEIVEEDVRKEEVDIDDPTQRLAGSR